jgi:hypothetical protein
MLPLVFAGIASIRVIALGSKVRVDGDRLTFNASWLHRLIILLGSAGALAVLLWTWTSSATWERAALAISALGIACGLPPSIVLDSGAIKSRVWWRPPVAIPWNQVSSIEENGAGEYEVYGQGKSLTFSRFLIDPQRFKSEVAARTHLKTTNNSDPVRVTPD